MWPFDNDPRASRRVNLPSESQMMGGLILALLLALMLLLALLFGSQVVMWVTEPPICEPYVTAEGHSKEC